MELPPGAPVERELDSGRAGWIQVFRGGLQVADHSLSAGDGLGVRAERRLAGAAGPAGTSLLFFDLAARA